MRTICAATLALGLGLAGAGCGTRVSRPDGLSASAITPTTGAASTTDSLGTLLGPQAAAAVTPGAASAPPVGGSGAPAVRDRSGREDLSSASAATGPTVSNGKPSRRSNTNPNAAAPSAAGSDTGAGAAPTLPDPPGRSAGPGSGGDRSVIKVGSVGTHSGPVGGVLKGAVEALQVWQRAVNDRGGLNGHPVKIIFIDDGGESARHLAAMRDLVEREQVIAFVQDSAPIGNGRSSIPYIESKRVPVIGSETGSPWFYESPMYFPQAPSGYLAFYAGVASHARAVAQGKKKLATIACAEVNACQDADSVYAKYAPGQGFDHVYRARASVTQPDFTAECLAARNAGANFLVFAADTASIGRATTSCARQSYRPTVGLLMSMITDAQRNDPNLVGALGTSNIFPWFQSNTPATAEFHAAMTKYLPHGTLGIAHATAWTSAKLLEKAASSLQGPPSSDGILRNLWTMKDETLGGLTRVSFSEGQRAAKIVCWYDLVIKDSQWASADGFTQRCVDPPPGL